MAGFSGAPQRQSEGEKKHRPSLLEVHVFAGLGPDGHLASLFPNRPEKHITDRPVVAVPEAGLEPFVPRISLTFPAINNADRKIFLVTGENKQEALQRAFGDSPDQELLAARVRPVTVYVDRAAAG